MVLLVLPLHENEFEKVMIWQTWPKLKRISTEKVEKGKKEEKQIQSKSLNVASSKKQQGSILQKNFYYKTFIPA